MVLSYNDTYHRTIGKSPSSVTKADERTLHNKMYGTVAAAEIKPKLKSEDKVRISKTRRTFDKGYLPNWTEEIFTISEAFKTNPPTYKLHDYFGDPIEGTFYEHEVQRVIKVDDVYKIESILNTRKRAGVKEYLVKWRGYPNKFNSWVKETDVVKGI